jgi:hypothetical protein
MDSPLDSLASLHFALLYIDENGKLRFESSSSVANDCQSILSPKVTDSFLRAVAEFGDGRNHASKDVYLRLSTDI